jgi:hypothetical protein
MQRISLLAEELLASQEGLCSMELVASYLWRFHSFKTIQAHRHTHKFPNSQHEWEAVQLSAITCHSITTCVRSECCSHKPLNCFSVTVYCYECYMWSIIFYWMTLRNTEFALSSTSDFGKLLWNHRKWYPGLPTTQQPNSSPLNRKACPLHVQEKWGKSGEHKENVGDHFFHQ